MEIIVRTTIIYFFLWAVCRGTGKRELSQMTAFELVLLVSMGDLVQQGVTQEDMSVTGALLAVGTIAAWIMAASFVAFRFASTRRVIDGNPVVIVRDGECIDEALRLERITVDEVKEGARTHGIGNLAEVRYGILEPDGRFSFITNGPDDVDAGDDGPRAV
jgi:uncharacterized membrane protein YcaP (DUF421 family)